MLTALQLASLAAVFVWAPWQARRETRRNAIEDTDTEKD